MLKGNENGLRRDLILPQGVPSIHTREKRAKRKKVTLRDASICPNDALTGADERAGALTMLTVEAVSTWPFF